MICSNCGKEGDHYVAGSWFPSFYRCERTTPMSKLAHSNDETMAQIERDYESSPQEVGEVKPNPLTEALYLANRDKESILKRLDTDIQRLKDEMPHPQTINHHISTGALGALEAFRKVIVEGGWTAARQPDSEVLF
jgi:hypothetical protein